MPNPSIIAERYKFWGCMQKPGESIANYAAELRSLANVCGFPANFRDEAQRDKFVHGLYHTPTRKALLAKDNTLTFAKALETAIAIELADADAIAQQQQ